MAITNWKSAGSGENDASVGDVAWTNPGNILASEDNKANSTLGTGITTTQTLRATQFGFTETDIPSDATINGIEVGVERRVSNQAGNTNGKDLQVQLRDAGGPNGNNKADTTTNWPGTDAEVVYGSPTDKWSSSFTAGQVQLGSFGLDFRGQRQNGAPNLEVDHIRIRIHYTPMATADMWQSGTDQPVRLAVKVTDY